MKYVTDKISLYLIENDTVDGSLDFITGVMLDTILDCNRDKIGSKINLKKSFIDKLGTEYDPSNPLMVVKYIEPCKCAHCGKELGVGRYFLRGNDGEKYCSSACVVSHFSTMDVIKPEDQTGEVITVPMFKL